MTAPRSTHRRIIRRLSWRTVLDNHEPPRTWCHGVAEVYEATDVAPETVVLDTTDMPKDSHRAVYLLDYGDAVIPMYVAGWRQELTAVFLHPFPLSVGTRADNGRPIDHSTWVLGPRRYFHIKVTGSTDVVEPKQEGAGS